MVLFFDQLIFWFIAKERICRMLHADALREFNFNDR